MLWERMTSSVIVCRRQYHRCSNVSARFLFDSCSFWYIYFFRNIGNTQQVPRMNQPFFFLSDGLLQYQQQPTTHISEEEVGGERVEIENTTELLFFRTLIFFSCRGRLFVAVVFRLHNTLAYSLRLIFQSKSLIEIRILVNNSWCRRSELNLILIPR